MAALEQRGDVDPSVLEVKSHYSLRSGYRRVPGESRNRRAVRPVGFISQSRDRYSDADDDGDGSSTIISDRETDGEDSDVSPNEGVESNGDSNDGNDDRQRRIAGPHLSDFDNEVEIPDLNLPDSSMDLMIDIENVQQTVGVYQVLRQFSRILCLSPFRFEDFCVALIVNEQSSLLVEAHISLLKCILQEEDNNNSTFGPHDARDSINISLFLVDSLTWFEVLRMYLDSLTNNREIQHILSFFSYRHYQDLNTAQRLLVLQTLSDLFLTTNLVREAIMKEGAFIHEEQCRLCHRRGDLICCETCPAVFHLECLNPPMKSVPDGDWYCSVCSALQVKGINECTSDKFGLLCRLEPLGFDRNHRKYWLLCRRIFVEGDHRTWYYSSSAQLEQLLLCLDGEKWESELVLVLKDMKSAIVGQMAVTEELTNKARGKRKAALASHDEFLLEQRYKLSVKVESEKMSKQKSVEEMAGIETVNSNEMSVHSASSTVDPSESSDFKSKAEVDCESVSSFSAGHDTIACKSEVNQHVHNEGDQVESKEEISENASAVCMEEAVREHYDGNSDDVPSALIGLCDKSDTLHHDKITSTIKDSLASPLALEMRQTSSMSRRNTNFPELESESLTDALKMTTSLFKLGMEGNYKNYVNLYSTNAVALSRQQQNDERDRRRHLSYKFSLTPRSDFSWNAVVYGLMRQTIDAVRKGLVSLEANIDRCYLHPNWGQNSGRWQRAVGFCSSASEFGLALMIFETCMKPLLFNNVWHESLGHVQLHRTTASEREERKKKEKDWKRLRNEDDYSSGTMVKYSLGLHHQVWKQKGEEYRSTGKGGWYWISSTRSSCHRPLMKCNHFFRDNCTSKDILLDSVNEEKAVKTESISSGCHMRETDSIAGANLNDEFTQGQESCLQQLERNTVENVDKFCDFFDISEALICRSAYHKRPLIKCFLDELLEKRKRLLELELKQKLSLELALKKFETEFALINHVTPHCTSSERCSESKVDALALEANSCSSYTAKLKFSKQFSGCLDESREMEEQEDDSDHEVILEKEDRDDNSSVESMVGDADDITMSEDSNLSNSSSFANVVPPPVRSAAVEKPPVKQTYCDLITNAGKSSNGLKSEIRRSDVDNLDAKSQIEFNFACNVIYPLEAYIKEGNVLLNRATAKEIKEKLSEIGKTEFPVKLSKLSGKKKRKHFRKGGIPVAHNFQTKGNKRSLFVIEKDQLITLARKGGQSEVTGFSYNCKMCDVDWPYPGPRPYFKTAWRYRTLTAASISAIALQLRILWANVRWDDMATKYPVGKSNTTVTDDYVTTVELLKRRDIGPTNLRAEYLVQKTVSPLEAPAANRERSLPPQRSGLRERRQPEVSVLKRPVTSELWVPEEQLELWEVRLFADRLEKKEHKQRERCSEKKSKAATPLVKLQEPSAGQNAKAHLQKNTETKHLETPPVKTVSAVVEEELQKQRLQMQQRRIGLLRGQQQNHQPPVIPFRTNERMASGTCRLDSAQNVIPGSLKLIGRRLITSKVSKHERSFSVSSVSSSRFVRPPSSPVKSSCQNPSASNMVSSPPSPAPSQSPLLQPSTIQSIRIKKGANGQLQVTGLQPGQEIIHLADGRLRLITKPVSSSPLSHQQPSHPDAVGSTSPSSSHHQASVVRNSESVKSVQQQQEEEEEEEEKILTNRKPESSDSVEAGGFSLPVQLMSSPFQLEKKSSEVEEIEQQKQPLHPLTPEQQTNATVANAVEKLFACLSPLRLKNRRRSSETKARENQSPGHEENCSKDSLARCNSADSALDSASHSSNLSHDHAAPVSATAFVQEAEEKAQDLNSLHDTGKLPHTTLTVSENDRVIAKSVDSPAAINVCHSSSLPVHVESQCLTYGQLIPMSALTPVSGGFLITVQSPSSGNGTLTEGNSVFEKVSSGNGHNVTPLPTTETLCRGSNEIMEIHKRKKFESDEEELSHSSKKKAFGRKMTSSIYHEDSEGDAVKEDLPSAESFSQQKPSPIVPDVVGRFKRKLNETSEDRKKRQEIRKDQFMDFDKAKLKGAKACRSSSSLRSESVKNRFPGSCTNESTSEAEALGHQLFCVCRTPYDSTRLYVGCDVCLDWFHASCVNLSRSKVLAIQSYVCEACRHQQLERQELFCICRQPYDESMFYIGCDECGGWFHGVCVGVSPTDVGRMDGYRCRVCRLKRDCDGVVVMEEQWTELKKLISMLKRSLLIKMSSKPSAVAKIYDNDGFVKEPFDLSFVERKIDERLYLHLKDFVVDVLNIFSSCLDSNRRTSHIARNAIALEREFLNSFEQLKHCLCSDITSQLDS